MARAESALRIAQKWEYKQIINLGELSTQELNEIGMEGWEMCGCYKEPRIGVIPATFTYYFKRPL